MHRLCLCHLRAAALCLMTALAVPAIGYATDPLPSIEVETDRPANIYLVGERLQMVLRARGSTSDFWYRLTDHEGVLRERGRLRASSTCPALLELAPLPTGLYTLSFKTHLGGAGEEVLCVIPDPGEGIGDGRIFGVNYRPSTDEQWDALARIGVRHLRAEFSWPAVETSPGQYDLRFVDYMVSNAKTRGLQLTVLTGHTPRFYSTAPVDRTGRVASAWFTWAPADTIEWLDFLNAIGPRLLSERMGDRPLVAAWEVWSEADQNFYYGDWNRYLDMLRVAYCALKQYDARLPVVYGSCGHWTEASYTVQSNCHEYFDLMAHHPGGIDPNHALGHWFVNMPQVFLKPGAPRESAYTECYFHPTDPRFEAGFQLRMFATLKSWRQRLFVRSGCLGGVIGDAGVHHHALLWKDGDRLVPRAATVGYAVARWLLEDAAYVGPLLTPSGIRYGDPAPPATSEQVELFVKNGRALVVGWGGGGSLRLQVEPGAQVIDHMGRARELLRSSYNLRLGPDAVAVYGAGWQHVAAALEAQSERLLTTELGYVCERNSGYIDPLQSDAALAIRAGFGDEVRAQMRQVCRRLSQRPDRAPTELFLAQRLLGEGMLTAARRCRDSGSFPPVARNSIWRLAQQCEELGMVADDLCRRWPREQKVSNREIVAVEREASLLRSQVRARYNGAECPFAERLLDRAAEQLDRVRASCDGARGAYWSALLQVQAARAVTRAEEPVMRRVFAVVNFPTGESFTKATLIAPGLQQRAQVRVYNFLDRAVSGTVTLSAPGDWGGARPAASFGASAGGCSELISLPFAVPDEPRPWVAKAAYRPCGELPVYLPEPLAPNTAAWVGGQIGGGPALPDMKYRLCVGSYTGGTGGTQLASR